MNLKDIKALDEAELTRWTLRIQKKIIEEQDEPGRSEVTGLLMTYVMERDFSGIRILASRFDVPMRTEGEQAGIDALKTAEELQERAALKKNIMDTFSDAMGSFLYYDRKEDFDLERGVIEQALKDGVFAVEDLVAILRESLGVEDDS